MDANAPDLESGNIGRFKQQDRSLEESSPGEPQPTPKGRKGEPASVASSGMRAPKPEPERRPLPPEPVGFTCEPESEDLCRIAAQFAGTHMASISNTALIIAFLGAEGSVSSWFRDGIGGETSIDRAGIFKSKSVNDGDRECCLDTARGGVLPSADPLYSRSARNLLDQTVLTALDMTIMAHERLEVGARHLIAPFAFHNRFEEGHTTVVRRQSQSTGRGHEDEPGASAVRLRSVKVREGVCSSYLSGR